MQAPETLLLGFLCGLIPGPVVTALLAESVRNGWAASRRIVFWAASGELLMSVVCVATLGAVDSKPVIFPALSIVGALLLLGLAKDLWKVHTLSEDEPLFSNRRVFLLSILNGMAWLFWITVCVPQAMRFDAELPGGRWLFIVLFELGWLAATLGLCRIFLLFRSHLQESGKLQLLYRSVAGLFAIFALRLAMNAGTALL